MMLFLNGERITLELFGPHLATPHYQKWLNDPEICTYTSRGVFPITQAQCEEYAKNCQTQDRIVLAIILDSGFLDEYGNFVRHIGNVTLQKIDRQNRNAELAILIGEKSTWGKGYGWEAALTLCHHGFMELGLNRIYCGTHEANYGMQKLAVKLGMREEGLSRQGLYKNGKFANIIHYGVLREEFYAHLGINQGQPLPHHA